MNPQLMNLGRAAAQEYYRLYYAAAIKQKRAGERKSTPRQWNALDRNEQQAMTEAMAVMMSPEPAASQPSTLNPI